MINLVTLVLILLRVWVAVQAVPVLAISLVMCLGIFLAVVADVVANVFIVVLIYVTTWNYPWKRLLKVPALVSKFLAMKNAMIVVEVVPRKGLRQRRAQLVAVPARYICNKVSSRYSKPAHTVMVMAK